MITVETFKQAWSLALRTAYPGRKGHPSEDVVAMCKLISFLANPYTPGSKELMEWILTQRTEKDVLKQCPRHDSPWDGCQTCRKIQVATWLVEDPSIADVVQVVQAAGTVPETFPEDLDVSP